MADAIGSDDDFADINYKRNSNGKRRVVFDFSDDENEDEDEEKVMSLSSPPEPQGKTEKTLVVKEEENLEDKQVEVGNSKNSNAGITLRAKSDAAVGGKGEGIDNNGAGVPGSPKRRKVLKTRIDERGREGTNDYVTLFFYFFLFCTASQIIIAHFLLYLHQAIDIYSYQHLIQ